MSDPTHTPSKFRIVMTVWLLTLVWSMGLAQVRITDVDPTPTSYELVMPSPQYSVDHESNIDSEDDRSGVRFRQSLLIGGLAVSMAAYGYFILEFNNSRGDADTAESAYEEDVRENAQSYVDQGIELDEIQSFKDWQQAFDDAKRSREWAARAGFLAIVIGFFAVLDAATSYDSPPPAYSGVSIHPSVSLAPNADNVMVGARVKF